jgi:TatD DNase family protein
MRVFDTHAHLQDGAFAADLPDVIERARNAGVTGILVLGVDVATSVQAIEMSRAYGLVFAAAGCHPHNADGLDQERAAALQALAEQPEVCAVGEIGLDFYRDLSPRSEQVGVFKQQLATARRIEKPVAVHCRDAGETLWPIVQEWSRAAGGRLPGGRPLGVMHYFAGDADAARRYVDIGFLISVHTSVTHPKSERLRQVARDLPLDWLVVETDSPYGAPQSKRGKRNEPAHVVEALREIARLRGESVERIAEATSANAARFLGIETAVDMRWSA